MSWRGPYHTLYIGGSVKGRLLQTKSSLDKIFYKVLYRRIIYMSDFFGVNLDFFCCGLHKFSHRL
jgi:hypothetical protein